MKKLLLLLPFISFTVTGKNYWYKISSPTVKQLTCVSFGSSFTGYISGADSTLLKTTDGGKSWTPLLATGLEFSGTAPDIINVNFINAMTGFAVVGNIRYPEFKGNIYKTIDGGSSWVLSSDAIACQRTFFFNADNGFQVGAGFFSGSNISKLSGGAWQSPVMLSSGPSVFLHAIDFFNTNTGMAAGDNGFVYRTFNGGITWDTIKTNIDVTINDLHYLNEHTIIAATSNFTAPLIRSTDAGVSWEFDNAATTFYYPAMKSVARSFKDSLIVVGTSETTKKGIIFTFNTEIPLTTEAEQALNYVAMANDSVAYIVGDSGLIMTNREETTGIKEPQAIDFALKVFPNPTTNSFYTEAQEAHVIFVFDHAGRLILKEDSPAKRHTIKMDREAKGTYEVLTHFEHGVSKATVIVVQ